MQNGIFPAKQSRSRALSPWADLTERWLHMKRYLTYTEYQSYGGSLSKEDFNLSEIRAQKRIDYLTDRRVADMEKVPEEVKLCIISLIRVDSRADSPLIASFNTDGYSESYGSAPDQIKVLQKAVDAEIREMLCGVTNDQGVPLLYRGLDL